MPYMDPADVACDGYRAFNHGSIYPFLVFLKPECADLGAFRIFWDKGLPYDYWYRKIFQP